MSINNSEFSYSTNGGRYPVAAIESESVILSVFKKCLCCLGPSRSAAVAQEVPEVRVVLFDTPRPQGRFQKVIDILRYCCKT